MVIIHLVEMTADYIAEHDDDPGAIDYEASADAYNALLEQNVRASYPDAEIAWHRENIPGTLVSSYVDIEDEDEAPFIDAIIERTWNDGDAWIKPLTGEGD